MKECGSPGAMLHEGQLFCFNRRDITAAVEVRKACLFNGAAGCLFSMRGSFLLLTQQPRQCAVILRSFLTRRGELGEMAVFCLLFNYTPLSLEIRHLFDLLSSCLREYGCSTRNGYRC